MARKTTFDNFNLDFQPPKVEDPNKNLNNLKTRLGSAGVDSSSVDDPRNSVEKFLNLPKDGNFLTNTLDIIQRPFHGLFEPLYQAKQGNVKDAGDFLKAAWEGYSGKERHGTQDLMPEQFRKEHPYLAGGAGFVGDVLLDPTTYITGGGSVAGKVLKPVAGALNGANRIEKIENVATGVGRQIEDTNRSIKALEDSHRASAKDRGLDITNKGVMGLERLSKRYSDEASRFTMDDVLKNYDKDILNATRVLKSVTRGVEKQIKEANAQGDILNAITQSVGKVRKPAKGDAFYEEFKMLPREIQNSKVFASSKNTSLPGIDEAANAMGKRASELLDALNNRTVRDAKLEAAQHPAVQKAAQDIADIQAEKQMMAGMRGQIDPSQFSPATRKLLEAQQKLSATQSARKAMKEASAPLVKKAGEKTVTREKLLGRDPATLAEHGLKNLNKVQEIGKKASDSLGKVFVPFFAVSKLIGTDGRTAKEVLEDATRNRDYLQSMALREPIQVARQFQLNEADMRMVLDVMETPQLAQFVDARIVQAAEELGKINEKWLGIARQAGFNVSAKENYVRHLLTDVGAKRLEQQGQKVSSIYGGHGISAGKTKMEAGRTIEGTVAEINDRKGMEFFNPNSIQATAAGSYEKATRVANANMVKQILEQFGHEVGDGGVPSGWKVFEFGDKELYGDVIDTSKRIAIPEELHKELQTLVQGIKSTELMKGWDKLTNAWKSIVTTTPSFHIRNLLGNFFNNWLAGIKNPKYYVWAKGIAAGEGTYNVGGRGYTGLQLRDMFMKEGLAGHGQFSDIEQRLEDVVAIGAKRGVEKLGHVLRKPLSRVPQASREIGTSLDEWTKIAHFTAMLDRGFDAKKAALSVEKYLFDYSKITDSERGIRRMIPFYTFTRKNLPLQLESLFTTPGTYMGLAHLQENAADAFGVDLSNMRDDLKNQFAIPLGPTDENGNAPLFAPNLPVSDLAKLNLSDGWNSLVSMMTPGLKIPIEQSTNMSTFTKRPIENYEGETKPYFGMDLEKTGGAYWLDQIPLARFLNSYVSPGEGKSGQVPVLDSIVKDFNQADAEKYANLDRLKELQSLQKRYEAQTGNEVPTMAQINKAQNADSKLMEIASKLTSPSRPKKPKSLPKVRTPKSKKPKVKKARSPKKNIGKLKSIKKT